MLEAAACMGTSAAAQCPVKGKRHRHRVMGALFPPVSSIAKEFASANFPQVSPSSRSQISGNRRFICIQSSKSKYIHFKGLSAHRSLEKVLSRVACYTEETFIFLI